MKNVFFLVISFCWDRTELEEVIAHVCKQSASNTTSTTTTSDKIGSTDAILTALNEVVSYSEQKPLNEVLTL